MNIQVFEKDGKLVTTSLNVAEVTEKAHKHVIADIERLVDKGSNRPNFRPVEYFIEATYLDAKGEIRKMYYLTKKGTAWLINRYTGDAAVDFQLAYIERFDEMERMVESVKQVAQVLTPHEESVIILKSQIDAGMILQVPTHLAQIEAVKEVLKQTGIDYNNLLRLAPAQDNIKVEEEMLEPKDLEIRLGVGKSGQKINKVLMVFEYQTNINGVWTPTDKAIAKYSRHSWTSNGKSGYNYKWNVKFVKGLIDNLIVSYGNIDAALKELIK